MQLRKKVIGEECFQALKEETILRQKGELMEEYSMLEVKSQFEDFREKEVDIRWILGYGTT